MDKRGLSTVVTGIIMILLVLVAVGIMWVVVKNLLTDTTDDINTGGLFLDLVVTNVKMEGGNLAVRVKRGIGEGDVIGLNFLVSDGRDTTTVELPSATLNELEEKTFTVSYSGLVKEIRVAPVLDKGDGKTSLGGASRVKELTDREMLGMMGAVSWWRFENGNTINDEFGLNPGTNYGADCSVSGQFGKGCAFDDLSRNYIQVVDSSSLGITDEITLAAWAKPSSAGGTVVKGIVTNNDYQMRAETDFEFTVRLPDNPINPVEPRVGTNIPISSTDGWKHIVGTYNGNMVSIYLDGALENAESRTGNIMETSNPLYIGGWTSLGSFNGTIDEVMIFDRALSATEVTSLYNYEFE